jgi:hypothetical protein
LVYNRNMDKGRVTNCDKCGKELEVRWGIFAHSTLARHIREHGNGKKAA